MMKDKIQRHQERAWHTKYSGRPSPADFGPYFLMFGSQIRLIFLRFIGP